MKMQSTTRGSTRAQGITYIPGTRHQTHKKVGRRLSSDPRGTREMGKITGPGKQIAFLGWKLALCECERGQERRREGSLDRSPMNTDWKLPIRQWVGGVPAAWLCGPSIRRYPIHRYYYVPTLTHSTLRFLGLRPRLFASTNQQQQPLEEQSFRVFSHHGDF